MELHFFVADTSYNQPSIGEWLTEVAEEFGGVTVVHGEGMELWENGDPTSQVSLLVVVVTDRCDEARVRELKEDLEYRTGERVVCTRTDCKVI